MKKINFILIAIISFGLTSCMFKPYIVYSEISYYDEFEGFFITESNSVSFEYEPVGSITAMVENGFLKGKYIKASTKDALRILYNEAEKSGANGIINLKFSYVWEHDKNSNITTLKGVIATGMAINKY